MFFCATCTCAALPGLMHPQHGCCSPQSILTDGDAAPAKDRGIAVAIMRLAAQVAGSPSELAALTLDAVAQCLHLEESTAAAASPEGGALAIFIFFVGSVASYNICSLQHEWPLTHPVSSLTPLWGLFLCVSMHVGRDTEGVVMAGFMGHSPEDILRNAVTLWGCVLLNTARIGSC